MARSTAAARMPGRTATRDPRLNRGAPSPWPWASLEEVTTRPPPSSRLGEAVREVPPPERDAAAARGGAAASGPGSRGASGTGASGVAGSAGGEGICSWGAASACASLGAGMGSVALAEKEKPWGLDEHDERCAPSQREQMRHAAITATAIPAEPPTAAYTESKDMGEARRSVEPTKLQVI